MSILKKLLEKISVKNVEEGERIRPIDKYETKNVFCDKELTKKCPIKYFDKNDEFEVISVTPHEIVAKVNKFYVVIDKNDLSEFENIE